MGSTFHGLETARRSLFTSQTALNTTGHNIANANTAGYTRQVVNMTASRSIEALGYSKSTAAGQLGTGVEASSIDRVRNRFLDDQFHSEYKWLGNQTVQLDTLNKLEGIVNEPSNTGLQTVLSNFWNAWSDLSVNPDSVDGRAVVKEQTAALIDTFNYTANQLNDLKSDLTENAEINLSNLNSIINTIAQLNGEIERIEAMGDRANDLRDQRDLLTDELSGLVNINMKEMSNGYSISMGGIELVNGKTATPLEMADVTAAIASGDLNNGAIYGTIYSRDSHVQGYIDNLNAMANTIANGEFQVTIPKGSILPEGTILNGVSYTGTSRELTEDLPVTVKGLNGLHQLGYTLSGEPGLPIFTDASGSTENLTALNLRLNSAIDTDPSKIATSMRVTFNEDGTETAVVGNNMMSVLMSKMRDTKFDFDSSNSGTSMNTIDTYFRSVVGKLGVQTSEAKRLQANQQTLVDQVDSNRMSVSGVSLDEEMSNMIKYQHAYNAAARNMTMIDEMLDRVINNMGRVGL
ncbi:flagellar hook-associated protein FlgK [Paenibacillus sp. FSL H8-0548]|uniref:flagellar hook-associated protein FlgK n=1 Tax=Paenibacillus sp. FSL H8-0548 TaxID=1920422 RepID=UPI00096F89D1|nr:flagellar hook-associated protein FlgK [Paenibacillus sp. FSL H8-0548]OMF35837.1 flagellar hook-associated protein FlgK [Paenibacillus sp. FSL H8-0548]